MTNKKFKKAAMALALTACVAVTPLAANAEAPEDAAGAQAPAAVDHTEADTQEAPEAELPVEEEPEAQPAAEAAAQPAAPEATPIAVELPTAEETPEEKEETPVEVTPTEDAVVEKATPAKVAPAPAKVAPAPAKADVDNLIEDPDADIATMDGAEKEVSGDEATITGGKSYSTLDDALKDANAGDEVVLQKDHTGNITIAEWIKLNLNKHKIEGNVDVDLSGTSQDGETTVDKKVEIVDGKITGATDSGVTIKDAGDTNVLLKDLTIEDNKGTQGGGVHIENSQNVTIDHCTIQNNKTTEVSPNTGASVDIGAGGGVFVSDKSRVTIQNGSTIQGNTGTRGGGIYVENSTVEVKNSMIDGNTADDVPKKAPNSNKGLGGGIYSYESTLTVTDSTISGNEAKGSTSLIWYNSKNEISSEALGNGGGGICAVGKKSDVTLDGVTVTGNKATYSKKGTGAGIEAQGGSLTVKDSTISNNEAQGNGGGIFSAEGNVLDVSGSTIQGNKADNGGGIHMGEARDTSKTPSKATITDTRILENEAIGSGEGGGVYVGGPRADATLKGCTVANNKSVSTGGGIAAKLGTVTLDDTTVENNQAVNGGGLFHLGIAVPGSLTLQNGSIIRNNTASSMGGGLFLWGNVGLKSDNSEISGNKALYGAGIAASQYTANFASPKLELVDTKVNSNGDANTVMGGGIYAAQGVVLNAKNTKFLDNTAKSGGGILLWSNSSADLNNSEVSGNKATGDGGGVYIWDSTCSLTASNGTVFRENSASNGGGILNNGVLTLKKGTSLVENSAGLYGGGLCSSGTVEVESGAKLYNNHAAQAGDDVYLFGKGSTMTLTKVGDDWMLDDCGHKINGWFLDGLDARWDADGKGEHVTNLDDFKADGYAVTKNEDGSYTITILDKNATLALKAAHNVTPKPTPDPDPEPTPDPDTPDTPVSPEGPTTPPVQDATPDDAETPVNPENPSNPPVQDATPDSTVAALPKTGVNWFTALAMALSGMALTVAGAFTSLFAKSKH
jgi:outer membrane biosynthesis protein TonB